MSRITKEDWIQRGIRVLNEEGYAAIKIEHLCHTFEVTKGSFYHHFKSIGNYEELLLKFWETATLGRIKEVVDSGQTPRERLNLMIKEVFSVSGKTELSLRAWALHNRIVKKYLDKMDSERIGVTRKLYLEVGVPAAKAGELAEFAYTAWLGIQCFYINGSLQKDKTVRLINDLLSAPIRGI